jgi:hypothetical protein
MTRPLGLQMPGLEDFPGSYYELCLLRYIKFAPNDALGRVSPWLRCDVDTRPHSRVVAQLPRRYPPTHSLILLRITSRTHHVPPITSVPLLREVSREHKLRQASE